MRRILAVGALLAGMLVPGVAHAAPSGTAEACLTWLGSTTADGAHRSQVVNATSPITVREQRTPGIFRAPVTISAKFENVPNPGDQDRSGESVINGALYHTAYRVWYDGELQPDTLRHTRVGGGWANFRFLENTAWMDWSGQTSWYRGARYALHNDGRLHRWNNLNGKRTYATAPGFGSVKSMTLIATTPAYDTFLANLKGGSLYAIRIPSAAQLKPVVTVIRKSTWQGFEYLVASPCSAGTLLTAIDKDTKTGYLYAIGHAKGTATPIKSYGKIPRSFADPVYFRWAAEEDHPNGD